MAKKTTKKTVVKTETKTTPVKTKAEKTHINELRDMYSDFKETLSEIVGDTGDFAKKHTFLIVIAFLLYLWNRNRTFTIEGFVKKLEDKLSREEENTDW